MVKKKEAKNAYAEKETNFAKGRQGILKPYTSVCVGHAYKPHIQESCHSSKPIAWISGHLWAARHPDPRG